MNLRPIVSAVVLCMVVGVGGCSQDKKPQAPSPTVAPTEKPGEKEATKPR